MGRELSNATITHVSYVDKGANQKKFFLTKSEEQPTFEKQVKLLTKADDAEKLVYGVVYEPMIEDAHGDFMQAEEIEKAAHLFMKEFRNLDTQHNFESGAGEVVESYVAPSDIQVGDETILKGSWVLVTKATDEVWESIQKGEITGYSMAGTAEVSEVEKAEDTQMKSFFKQMRDFFTKGEVKDKFHSGKKQREFMDAYWIFDDIFFSEIWSSQPNIERIKSAATDFADLLQDIANSPDVLKALGNIEKSQEVVKMKKEDFVALLKEELAPLTDRLAKLEKEEAPTTEPTPEEVQAQENAEVQKAEASKEDLIKSFKEVLKEELAPLSERLDTVEKARGISKSAEHTEEVVEKSEPSVFGSLFGA